MSANLDADMASTLIVLAVLLGGAIVAILANQKAPTQTLTEADRRSASAL